MTSIPFPQLGTPVTPVPQPHTHNHAPNNQIPVFPRNTTPRETRKKSMAKARHIKPKKYFTMITKRNPRVPDDRDSNLVRIRLDDHPRGYPRTAVYLNSDIDSALYRRFGDLHARSLLYKQVELTNLEEQLSMLDREDAQVSGDGWKVTYSIHVKNGRRNEARKNLIDEIDRKMEVYDNLLLRDKKLRELPKPRKRDHRNFMDYIYTENSLLGPGEKNFIYHEHDFVILQDHEDSWLDDRIKAFMGKFDRGFLRYFVSYSLDRQKTDDPDVNYQSYDIFTGAVKVVIAVASTALLLVPVFVFLASPLSTIKMAGITLLFALVFAIMISFCTSAKRQDVFAATAAYCAVLVVFIGNLQQSQLSGKE